MKPIILSLLILAASVGQVDAVSSSSKGRKLTELKVIPTRILQRFVSRKFYQSLLISPVEGMITVRGQLSGTRLAGLRVIKSDLNGTYDALALKLAGEVRMAGNPSTERPNTPPSVLLHLLIYNIADGTMALSFAHLDEPGGDQLAYYGCAKLAVLKSDGRWTQIDGPPTLGDTQYIKQGPSSSSDALKMHGLSKGAEATNMGAGSDK
jgi:hypothetical protein